MIRRMFELRAYTPGDGAGLVATASTYGHGGVFRVDGTARVEHAGDHVARFGLRSISGFAAYVEVPARSEGGNPPMEAKFVVQTPGAMPVEKPTGVEFGDALPSRPFSLEVLADRVRLTLDGAIVEIPAAGFANESLAVEAQTISIHAGALSWTDLSGVVLDTVN